ncbi:hypothetical protein [Streptomyces sp. NPDC055085]
MTDKIKIRGVANGACIRCHACRIGPRSVKRRAAACWSCKASPLIRVGDKNANWETMRAEDPTLNRPGHPYTDAQMAARNLTELEEATAWDPDAIDDPAGCSCTHGDEGITSPLQ